MSEKKPSEQIDALAEERTKNKLAEMQAKAPHVRMPRELESSVASTQTDLAILTYLDAEHERRAEFERGVLERLEKLERDNADGLIGETEHGDRVFRYVPEPESEEA